MEMLMPMLFFAVVTVMVLVKIDTMLDILKEINDKLKTKEDEKE
jgi:hypothetical protein